jgi:hypothetical protein
MFRRQRIFPRGGQKQTRKGRIGRKISLSQLDGNKEKSPEHVYQYLRPCIPSKNIYINSFSTSMMKLPPMSFPTLFYRDGILSMPGYTFNKVSFLKSIVRLSFDANPIGQSMARYRRNDNAC